MERFQTTSPVSDPAPPNEEKFVRGLGLLDSTMLVAGSMIGSGIYIVSADIARLVGSSGWLLVVWMVTGALTIIAALELWRACCDDAARRRSVCLFARSLQSAVGISLRLDAFSCYSDGHDRGRRGRVLAFSRCARAGNFTNAWIIPPIILSRNYAVSLSSQQLIAILIIVLLTFVNTRGLRLGKIIQNIFTSAKTLSLFALIVLGIFVGRHAEAVGRELLQHVDSSRRFSDQIRFVVRCDGFRGSRRARDVDRGLCRASRLALFVRRLEQCYVHGRRSKRSAAQSAALARVRHRLVITLYLLANVAYLCVLPLEKSSMRPTTASAQRQWRVMFGGAGAAIMAVAIMISTFGCCNGLILAGARVYYAMAQDGLFFRSTGRLNAKHVPAMALVLQGMWTALLVLPRTRLRDPVTDAPIVDASGVEQYGNLYGDLLDYVVFAVLIFYVLTIAGCSCFEKRALMRNDLIAPLVIQFCPGSISSLRPLFCWCWLFTGRKLHGRDY